MREIKFRGWDKIDKRWIPISTTEWKTDLDEFPYLIGDFFPTGEVLNGRQIFDCKDGKTTFLTLAGKLVDVYPYGDGSHRTFIRDISQRFELMQYTGLKDKQGKEIYEGDIVKSIYCQGIYEVRFNDGAFQIFASDSHYKHIKDADGYAGFLKHALEQIEVIGNIYENPELLKP